MKYSNYFLLILTIVFLSCKGQDKKNEEWKPFTDSVGNFQIGFESKPLFKTETQQYGFGNIIWHMTFLNKPDNSNYNFLIKYADFPENIVTSDSSAFLNNFFLMTQEDLITKKIPYNLRTIEILDYPGREFHFLDTTHNLAYTRHVFLVNNRLYFLEVKSEINNDYRNEIDFFFDSFKLINTRNNIRSQIDDTKQLKKFQVNFPGETSITTQTSFSELFGNVNISRESYETTLGMYGVNFAKLPDDKLEKISEKQLKDFITKAFTTNVLNTNGKIISQKEITINNRWALEGIGSIQEGEIILHIRSVIVKNYYYQVFIMYEKGKVDNQKINDFLNSFKIVTE